MNFCLEYLQSPVASLTASTVFLLMVIAAFGDLFKYCSSGVLGVCIPLVCMDEISTEYLKLQCLLIVRGVWNLREGVFITRMLPFIYSIMGDLAS